VLDEGLPWSVAGMRQAAGMHGGHDADGGVVVNGEDGGGPVESVEQGTAGGLTGLHGERVAGQQRLVEGDPWFG
jgi:hypothetical protein